MNFSPHATSAMFAKICSHLKNNPFRLYPDSVGALREPSPKPHATFAMFAKICSHLKNNPFRLYPDSVGAWRPWREQSVTQSPTTNPPFRPWREQSAFSLTEVVIAMGVAAVAFTSIIALFPLGLNMSKESYEATQAALIAQSILADLKDATSAKVGGKLIQISGFNAFSMNNYTNVPMSGVTSITDRTIYLTYDQSVRTDSSGSPIMLRPKVAASGSEPSWFTTGTNGPILLVKILIRHSFLLGGAANANNNSNPQRVDVTVESPASAQATNRTQYVFTGLVPQG